MKAVNIHEAKTKLSAILAEIEAGESYLICKNGVPIADLVPHKKKMRTMPHSSLSKIKINFDPIEILSEDEWSEIE